MNGHDRIDALIGNLRRAQLCAVPATTLITVQENVRLARRLLDADDMDPTSASIARNAIRSACEAMDNYAGERA